MSEKKFAFDEESYVAFTGDMLNPRLNIKGVLPYDRCSWDSSKTTTTLVY